MTGPRGVRKRRRVLYVQYTNPAAYPPLEHSSRMLANAGWEVLFLGTGALGADTLRFPPHARIRVRRLRFQRGGWRQKLHYLGFMAWVLWWTLRWRPDWVYASDPLACPIALLLSYARGTRVLYHEHDSPSEPSRASLERVWLSARHALSHRAAVCILPNGTRAGQYLAQTGRRAPVLCVWNCPSRADVAAPHDLVDGTLWLLYHGSIIPSRLPTTVIAALARLPEYAKLRVVGYETIGSVGYSAHLRELARTNSVIDRIEFVGPVQRADLMHHAATAHVGLSLMPAVAGDPNQKAMVGASNKAFDYLGGGLALLVSDLPDWRTTYVEPGFGLGCNPDDPESIATALRWFLEHPAEMREMGERGRQRVIADWNYETQFAPAFTLMNSPGTS